jgi:ABC-type oligopeptide transport system substrate-binding subunit
VRRGQNNFDRIEVKIYKDATARLEALKAGEFDLMRFFSAGDWARRVNGKKFDSGELVKGEFAHKLPAGFQSYVLNTRKPFLQDARVREALGLAIDYEPARRTAAPRPKSSRSWSPGARAFPPPPSAPCRRPRAPTASTACGATCAAPRPC